MDVRDKTILITGATGGIGKALGEALTRRGARIIAVGRNVAPIAESGWECLGADLSSRAGVDDFLTAFGDRPIDALVNNAGMGAGYEVDRPIDRDALDAMIFLNLNAPMHLVAALLPGLRQRRRAMIVNVSSGLAIAPTARGAAYSATKAGLRSFTQSLRAQLRGTQVQVVEALPPLVATNMTAWRGTEKGMITAAQCAEAIARAMTGGHAEAMIGKTALLDRVYGLSPRLARGIMLKFE